MKLFENKAVGTDDDIYVVRGKMFDNHVMSGGVLTDEGIWNFAKKIYHKESEWNARIEGEPKHFAGLIYGDELDRDIHVIKSFDVPPDWTFYEGIDPHDGKPTNWGFFAVSDRKFVLPESKRKVYRSYMIDWLALEGKSITGMMREVKIKRASLGYLNPHWVVVDARYARRTQQTGMNQTCWHDELRKADIGVPYVLSDSSPGSVSIGHRVVKEYLISKYSSLEDRMMPTFCFFDRCDTTTYSMHLTPVQAMFSYAMNEEGKVIDTYKDWPDVIRYFLTKYPAFVERRKYFGKDKQNGHTAWAA